jgi:hypothetical protein
VAAGTEPRFPNKEKTFSFLKEKEKPHTPKTSAMTVASVFYAKYTQIQTHDGSIRITKR